MLQQTKVTTVIPFQKFIKKWPTLDSFQYQVREILKL